MVMKTMSNRFCFDALLIVREFLQRREGRRNTRSAKDMAAEEGETTMTVEREREREREMQRFVKERNVSK